MFESYVHVWRASLRGALTRVAAVRVRAAAMAVGTIAVPLTLAATQASAAQWTMVAHWHMDETSGTTMADAVADHTGTTSDVKTGLFGHAGHGYRFDGESSYASVPSAAALNPSDRDIRISLWLKTADKPDRPDWDLVKKGYFDHSPGLFKVEYQPTGRASCGFLGTQGSAEVTGGPDLADGQWHKVSCTKTAALIGLTVDAQAVATKEVTIGEIANTNRLMIGAYEGPGGTGHFLGMLDEVVIEMTDGSAGRGPGD